MTTNELSRDLVMLAGLFRERQPGNPWQAAAAQKIEAAANQIELDWNIIETYQALVYELLTAIHQESKSEDNSILYEKIARLAKEWKKLPKVITTRRGILGEQIEMTTRKIQVGVAGTGEG